MQNSTDIALHRHFFYLVKYTPYQNMFQIEVLDLNLYNLYHAQIFYMIIQFLKIMLDLNFM
jgi:hypothetical protein